MRSRWRRETAPGSTELAERTVGVRRANPGAAFRGPGEAFLIVAEYVRAPGLPWATPIRQAALPSDIPQPGPRRFQTPGLPGSPQLHRAIASGCSAFEERRPCPAAQTVRIFGP